MTNEQENAPPKCKCPNGGIPWHVYIGCPFFDGSHAEPEPEKEPSDLRRQLESVTKERDALYGNVLNRESCWHAAERELVTVQQSRDSWQRRAEVAEKTLKEISEQLGDLIPKLQSLL